VTDLTSRQAKFVDHYVICGNAAEAARLAGYSAKSAKVRACRLTKDNRVAAEIGKRQAENAVQLALTKDDVIAGLLGAINMAREQQNPAAMIGGLVQLGKMCGFYEPEVGRIELSGDGERLQAKFAAMSDRELLTIATGMAADTATK
jgi:hypothetical protein